MQVITSESARLCHMDVTLTAWALTVGFIIFLLAIDLVIGALKPHAVHIKEATAWSVGYIAIALLFGLVVGQVWGWEFGSQYYAGYLVEKSLSIDNLFVFIIIMTTFAVPEKHRQKVLTFGIIFALILRAIFIAVGSTLLNAFDFMFLVFGLILFFTAIQLFRHRNEDPDIESNGLVKASRRFLPTTDEYHDGKLVTKVDGKKVITPLMLVLIAIGGTDLLFALDSIPAVFGVTQEAYIVFAANAFALLGLRALFFLVQGLLDRLVYLSSGLAIILAFIGLKLSLHWAHETWSGVPEISTSQSLIFIGVVLVITTVASLIKVRRDPSAIAHAGSVSLSKPKDEAK